MRRDQASVSQPWRTAPGGAPGGARAMAGTVPARKNGFTPSVLYLLVLVGVEIGAYCLLRYAFRGAHGG